MKAGAENRKKTIALGVLGAIAVCGLLYNLSSLFSGPSTPPPAIAPVSSTPVPSRTQIADANGRSGGSRLPGGNAAVPGVAAQRLASASTSLDPTLDQAAMLRTESLMYSGSGRNIFSATYVAPTVALPTHVPSARPQPPIHPPVVNTGPPPPAPIPLKFFGTAQRSHGEKKAFLLSGDDVYLASPGDIVAKRYRIGQIQAFGVQVTDLGNSNTQMIPLQQQ